MLKFGIMGCGGIACKFAEALKLVDGVEAYACASKSAERASAFAENNGILHACTYGEMLGDSEVDVVYIATTNNFHYGNIKACLEAGKHVLCEKPMVMTEAEARELFGMAEEKGLFLMEAMWTVFLPSLTQARKWILDGKIGDVQSAASVIGFKPSNDMTNRLWAAELEGGALYDIGVYPIEIISFLVGEPIVGSMGICRRNAVTGVDENDVFILDYGKFCADIQCLFTSAPKEYIIINGSKCFVEIPTVTGSDECYLYNHRREVVGHFKERFPQFNGFVFEIGEVKRCIEAGKLTSDIMSPEKTFQCARVYDNLLRK